jgi:hypothetical protein
MPYILATYALEKSDRLFMKSMIEMANKRFGLQWSLDDLHGQVTVVDIDTEEGRSFWKINSARKTLIAYAQTNTYLAPFFLEKPLKVQLVTDLLKKLTCKISPTSTLSISYPSTVSLSSQASSLIVDYKPENYLAGLLKNILSEGKPYILQLTGTPPLYVVPDDQMCYTIDIDLSDNTPTQQMWMKSTANLFSKSPLDNTKLDLIRHDFVGIDINAFIWVSTLQSSNGNLLTGHSLTNTAQLKEWPNFSILPYDSTQIQLAAFMSKNIASIPRISANTRQPIPHIINFYNACVMLDLINIEKITQEISETTKNISTEKKSLLQSILQRLLK